MDDVVLQQELVNPKNRVERLLAPRRVQSNQGERHGNHSKRDVDYAQYIHGLQTSIRFWTCTDEAQKQELTCAGHHEQ